MKRSSNDIARFVVKMFVVFLTQRNMRMGYVKLSPKKGCVYDSHDEIKEGIKPQPWYTITIQGIS